MNTNPDAFENDLCALKRSALPESWRHEILPPVKQVRRTPRWLVAGWSAAWAAILVMHFTRPREPDTRTPAAHHSPVMRWDERAAMIDSLLASN